ncbi:HPr family phosphocarrier protein [Coralloluteibacterium stylophorae]|uniref:HPr family phosphocarrier protein n=1 Tax=Coralloluteibacterium stylophorae TaxID=1776034 RepID=A0A8J8AYI0_9GAMM|nr:HPr family phosphocarrier protein [Coralloluteibacterium stylophorae]
MIEKNVAVVNRLGLHARAAARLVQLLSGFKADAAITAKGRTVNGKSIMGVMLLAAGQGSTVTLRLDGEDEAAAMDAAADLFARGFDEES